CGTTRKDLRRHYARRYGNVPRRRRDREPDPAGPEASPQVRARGYRSGVVVGSGRCSRVAWRRAYHQTTGGRGPRARRRSEMSGLTSLTMLRHTLLWLTLLYLSPAPAAAQVAGDGGAYRFNLRRLRDTVGAILDAGVRDSAFPGAVAVVGTRHDVLVERAAGHLDWGPSPPPNDSTLWDLASLTKVVATTT